MTKTLLLTPGTLLQNRYFIERQIAKSLMGAVYEATDQRFGSIVALKQIVIWDDDLRSELQEAFQREARLLNKLRHPALPVVHDYFTEDDGQFLVMQFISGETLGSLLTHRNRPFDHQQVLQWADRILDALEYLHGQDPPIIHRDIKPANLKLTERGELFLLDFGLAKESLNLSLYGYTREYASYEQIQGLGTDPRSDLYSLAATLYRLMTGRLPPDALTRAGNVMRGQPDSLQPAHKINPLVPVAVAKVLHCAMSQNPDERPQSATAMRIALKQASQIRELDETTKVSDEEKSIQLESQTPTLISIPSLREQHRGTSGLMLNPQVIEGQIVEETPTTHISQWSKRDRRSKLLYWLSLSVLIVLIIFAGVFIYRISKTVAAHNAFTEGSQLMAEHTDSARQRALMKFQEAAALSRSGGSKTGEADSLYNIGRVYYEMGDKKKSLDYFNQALEIYRSTNDHTGRKATLRNISAIYAELGDRTKAQEFRQMAEEAK